MAARGGADGLAEDPHGAPRPLPRDEAEPGRRARSVSRAERAAASRGISLSASRTLARRRSSPSSARSSAESGAPAGRSRDRRIHSPGVWFAIPRSIATWRTDWPDVPARRTAPARNSALWCVRLLKADSFPRAVPRWPASANAGQGHTTVNRACDSWLSQARTLTAIDRRACLTQSARSGRGFGDAATSLDVAKDPTGQVGR